MDLSRFSALLSGLYDAALDPAQWSQMAPRLADAFMAESCGLIIQPTGAIAVTANFDAKVVADYAAHYHKVDVLSNDVTSKAGLGKPLIREEFLSNADWRASEIYNDAYRRAFLDSNCRGSLRRNWSVNLIPYVYEDITGARVEPLKAFDVAC